MLPYTEKNATSSWIAALRSELCAHNLSEGRKRMKNGKTSKAKNTTPNKIPSKADNGTMTKKEKTAYDVLWTASDFGFAALPETLTCDASLSLILLWADENSFWLVMGLTRPTIASFVILAILSVPVERGLVSDSLFTSLE
jgi:hypothetical protein